MSPRIEISIEADEALTQRLVEALADLLPPGEATRVRSIRPRSRPRPKPAASAPPDLAGFITEFRPDSHTELVTVLAYVAEVKGLPGLNLPTTSWWSESIGWEQPADWRFILTNATRSGHLQSIGRGLRVVGPKGRSLLEERFGTAEEVVVRTP